MSIEQYTDKDGPFKQSQWMHWNSRNVSSLQSTNNMHLLYILQLVGMLEQYTDKDGPFKQSQWMHWRNSRNVSIMHSSQHANCRKLYAVVHCYWYPDNVLCWRYVQYRPCSSFVHIYKQLYGSVRNLTFAINFECVFPSDCRLKFGRLFKLVVQQHSGDKQLCQF